MVNARIHIQTHTAGSFNGRLCKTILGNRQTKLSYFLMESARAIPKDEEKLSRAYIPRSSGGGTGCWRPLKAGKRKGCNEFVGIPPAP